MAEKRRLQSDIDRTLKKVHEGRTSFKETLDKFESATNHAQKEKHEADLKKEIKKLQRFRDNIKTWLASAEVKDKSQLTEVRKLIESDMERFKVIEKETKTKAYSKEGLYTETKKDPMQKEKEEHLEWLKLQISRLHKKVETCDFDIVNLNAAKRKRNVDKEKLTDLSQKLGMYKNHIAKQETLMRLVDNDKIEMDKIKDFRDSFEDFINAPDNEMYKNDQGLFIYDDLNLDELSVDLSINPDLDLSGKVETTGDNGNFPTNSNSGASTHHNNERKEIDEIPPKIETIVTVEETNSEKSYNVVLLPVASKPVEQQKPKERQTTNKSTSKHKHIHDINDVKNTSIRSQTISITSTPIKTGSSVPLDTSDFLSSLNISDSSIKEQPIILDNINIPSTSIIVSSQPVKTANTPILETVSAIDTIPINESHISEVVKTTVSHSENNFSMISTTVNQQTVSHTQDLTLKAASTTKLLKFDPPPPPPPPLALPAPPSMPDVPSTFDLATSYIPSLLQNEINMPHLGLVQSRGVTIDLNQFRQSSNLTNTIIMNKDNTFDMILEPGDAMSPFRNPAFQCNDYYINQVSSMDHGRLKQPLQSDSEKARMIIYKQEVSVPEYFPKEPISGSDTEEYYMRLDSDTLFFIFYYFEGTKAQYLAAKALKRMSWRFHTGHMCWFQRHEEPKQITDNSESGTYIFYDFESMSRQKKENFTFSYNFLEDKDF